jgi:hypothetical protein
LRGAVDAKLAALRQIFERVRAAYGSFKGTWIAADFEAWEYHHEMITEFGFAEMKWLPAAQDTPPINGNVDGKDKTTGSPNTAGQQRMEPVVTRTGHWILKENREYRNGNYVADNRYVCSFSM